MTTDYITLYANALKVVAEKVVGLQSVFDPPPPKIDSAQLPALYILTGGTDSEDITDNNFIATSRMYRVQVAVMPIGQGNPYSRETIARPLIENVKSVFRKYPSLGGAQGVQSMKVVNDSGIVILPEYGMKFIGFEVTLRIISVIPREYATGE